MKIKKIILTLIYCSLCLVANGQISISGKVTDEKGEPIFGAEVYAPEFHVGTVTDSIGKFKLKNIPHGYISLVFSHVGYETYFESLDIHKSYKNFNVILKEAIFSMDEVIISTPFNRLQSKNVMKVEAAKISKLKQMGAATLIEGIETIPGVSQISTGTSIGKPVIRGLSGNRVLVYTQGVRLENQQFGDEHGLGLNEAGIESVEVIKGPSSLLYGSDALGGVMYFNPEKFAPNNTAKADFNQQYFSNTIGSNSSVGFKNSYESFKFLVRGSYNTHADYKIPNGKRVTNTRYKEFNFNTGLSITRERFASELRYNLNNADIGLTEGIGNQSTNRSPELPYQNIKNHIISLHNHLYFDTSKLDFNLGYIFNDRSEFEDEHGHEPHTESHAEDVAALRMKLKTLSYDVKYNLPKIKTVQLIAGLQGMHQTNENLGEELLIPNAKINDIGVFATAIADFDWGAMQGGLRFDNRKLTTEYHEVIHEDEIHVFEALDNNYNNLTGSLGVKRDFLESITTRVNLSSGFRAPNLAELTSNGVHHGTNRFEIGNPNLLNEQNLQLDIALEYNSKYLELFLNGFYNGMQDYIFLSPTGNVEDGADVYEYIQGDAKLYGGEMGFHFHPHKLDWLHLESSFELVIGKQANGDFLPLIPANQWNNTLRAEFKIKNWWQKGFARINVASSFAQNNVSMFETPTDAYSIVNLGFGGSLQVGNLEFDLSASLNNAFDTSYTAHLSRLKSDGIPNIGRNFILGLHFEL